MKVRGIHGQLFDPKQRSFVAIRTQRRIFPHVRIALAVVLAACSSKSDKPPPPSPPAPIPADATRDAVDPTLDLTQPCLPQSLASANIAYVRADGARVTVCYGNGDDSPGSVTACLVLDELGEILGPRAWEDAERARLGELELGSATVDIEVEDGVSRPAIASLDNTRAFVFVEDRGAWRGRFYDLRTEKQIGDIALAKLDPASEVFVVPYHLREVRWVGTRVIVTDRVEVGPEYHSYLLSSSGEHLALADEHSSYSVIDADLIVALRGKELHFIDVEKLVDAGTLVAPGASSPLAAQVRVAKFSDQLVVAHARPAGVFFVDRAKRTKTVERAIPICQRAT